MAKENGTAGSVSDEEKQLQEDMDELSKIGDIEVENGILTVSITLPAEYMEGVTQEQLDAGKGTTYQSATLNDDGSVTYKMTKQQHREMLKSMSDSVDQSMQELIDDDNYTITGITHNDNYTVFDVTLEGTEVGFADSFTSDGLLHVRRYVRHFQRDRDGSCRCKFPGSRWQCDRKL